jgi:hypothetical protein
MNVAHAVKLQVLQLGAERIIYVDTVSLRQFGHSNSCSELDFWPLF